MEDKLDIQDHWANVCRGISKNNKVCKDVADRAHLVNPVLRMKLVQSRTCYMYITVNNHL